MKSLDYNATELVAVARATGLVLAGIVQIDAWTCAPVFLRPERSHGERCQIVLERLNGRRPQQETVRA